MEEFYEKYDIDFFKKIIKSYGNDYEYGNDLDCTESELIFIKKYEIIELFIHIFERFDPYLHIEDSYLFFKQKLDEWNKDKIDGKLSEDFLTESRIILVSNIRAIINPYLVRDKNVYKGSEFVEYFLKYRFYFPLLNLDQFEGIIENHNLRFGLDLNNDLLIQRSKSLYEAVWNNVNGLQFAMSKAIIQYILTTTEKNIKDNPIKYINLIVELSHFHLPFKLLLSSITSAKRELLKEIFITHISNSKEIQKIEDLNYLRFLMYVRYIQQGVDIYDPPEDSHLGRYREENFDNLNEFDKLKKYLYAFEKSIETASVCEKLYPEIEFYIFLFEEANNYSNFYKILTENNSVYVKTKIYWLLEKNPEYILYFTPQVFNYYIIHLLISLHEPYVLKNNILSEFQQIRYSAIIKYLNLIPSTSISYFNLLLDLYFFLPNSLGNTYYERSFSIKWRLRSYLITRLPELIDKDNKNLIIKYYQDREANHDFEVYALLISCRSFIPNFYSLILEKYSSLMSMGNFYYRYFGVIGITNLAIALNETLKGKWKDYLFIDFIKMSSDADAQSEKYYTMGSKLRFHLGVLSTLIDNNYSSEKSEIADYILESYKYFRNQNNNDENLVSWNVIVSDSFVYDFENKYLKIDNLLTYKIVSILKQNRSSKEQFVYFTQLKPTLTFLEKVIFVNELGFENERKSLTTNSIDKKEMVGTGVGWARINAFILSKFGYYREALKYISYIRGISKKYRRDNLYNDNVIALKFEAYIGLKHYGRAKNVLKEFSAMSTITSYEGLIYYLKGDYQNARTCFDNYLRNNEPSLFEIVNYSATLIKLGDNLNAIRLIERHIEDYKDEYLLFLNLSAAYQKVDEIQSLFYLNKASKLTPKSKDILYEILSTIINLPQKLIDVYSSNYEINELSNLIANKLQEQLFALAKVTFYKNELRIIKEVKSAIRLLISKHPLKLAAKNEPDISDEIQNLMNQSLQHVDIHVDRENRGGIGVSEEGEMDFFIYNYGNFSHALAIGENKSWKDETTFKKQLGQLLGYMPIQGEFAFTILINRTKLIDEIRGIRDRVLNDFKMSTDTGELYKTKYYIRDMVFYKQEFENISLSIHEDPTNSQKQIRIYHFLLDLNPIHQIEAAKYGR